MNTLLWILVGPELLSVGKGLPGMWPPFQVNVVPETS